MCSLGKMSVITESTHVQEENGGTVNLQQMCSLRKMSVKTKSTPVREENGGTVNPPTNYDWHIKEIAARTSPKEPFSVRIRQ